MALVRFLMRRGTSNTVIMFDPRLRQSVFLPLITNHYVICTRYPVAVVDNNNLLFTHLMEIPGCALAW